MIYSLNGEVIIIDALLNTAVIDCMGVGYKVTASDTTIQFLSTVKKGDKIRIFTYMAVREDSAELFGFKTENELKTFKTLISVSGVGPKAAIAILSALSPDALAFAISNGDTKAICKAQGVGKRIAERIILELKDKLAVSGTSENTEINAIPSDLPKAGGSLNDARDALIVLGYSKGEVETALKGSNPKSNTEELIRYALARLM